jgi:hypothetical protein
VVLAPRARRPRRGRLARSRERLHRGTDRPSRILAGAPVRGDPVEDPRDRPVGARAEGTVGVPGPHRRGPAVPGARETSPRRHRRGRGGAAGRERPRGGARVLRRRRLRDQPRPSPARLHSRHRRRRGVRDDRRRPRQRADRRRVAHRAVLRGRVGQRLPHPLRGPHRRRPTTRPGPASRRRDGDRRRRGAVPGGRRAVLGRCRLDPQRPVRRDRLRVQDHLGVLGDRRRRSHRPTAGRRATTRGCRVPDQPPGRSLPRAHQPRRGRFPPHGSPHRGSGSGELGRHHPPSTRCANRGRRRLRVVSGGDRTS